MRTFIGIDGIPGAWVAVYLAENQQYFDYGHLDRLLAIPYVRAMIDVPIGLPLRGYRTCDMEARERVKSRVFLGARWNVWKFESYRNANDHYWDNDDEGISKQLWGIRDKLKEVNEVMTPAPSTGYFTATVSLPRHSSETRTYSRRPAFLR